MKYLKGISLEDLKDFIEKAKERSCMEYDGNCPFCKDNYHTMDEWLKELSIETDNIKFALHESKDDNNVKEDVE